VLGLTENAVLICEDQRTSYWNSCAFAHLLSKVAQIKKKPLNKYSAGVFTYTFEACN
jgi:hypothetical protein